MCIFLLFPRRVFIGTCYSRCVVAVGIFFSFVFFSNKAIHVLAHIYIYVTIYLVPSHKGKHSMAIRRRIIVVYDTSIFVMCNVGGVSAAVGERLGGWRAGVVG